MKSYRDLSQLFLRFALGIGFIVPGLDRLGVWGPHGAPSVTWGDWQHFFAYARSLMYFLPDAVAEILAIIATLAELVFGALLLMGLFTRWAAFGSGLLALCFALFMTMALGIRAPLNYSVFTASAAGFVLATFPVYRWSLDNSLKTDRPR